MPPAVVGWNAPIFLQSATTGVLYNATVRDNHRHREHEQKGETRLAMPVRQVAVSFAWHVCLPNVVPVQPAQCVRASCSHRHDAAIGCGICKAGQTCARSFLLVLIDRNHAGRTSLLQLPMLFRFYGELPDNDDFYELHIDGWDRFAYIATNKIETVHQKFSPEVWIVLPPLRLRFGLQSSDAATLLVHNVRYHVALGFKMTAYVLLPQLEAYRQHAELQQYILDKKLELVLWDDIPECQHFRSCQHTMETSHAALAAWGTNRLLMFLDIDEYVAFPTNITVRSFVDSCFAGNGQAVLPRFDVGCSQSQNESAFWFVSRGAQHPLNHYDVIMRALPRNNGKTVADPTDVLGFAIHSGHSLRGNLAFLSVECGRILHVANMFAQRSTAKGSELSARILRMPPGMGGP